MKTMKTIKGRRNMAYLALPIIAGIAISMQGILSSKIGTKSGYVETAVLIHLFGLIAALVYYFATKNISMGFIFKAGYLPLIAGSMGVIIVICTAKSVTFNGAALTIIISILVQMIVSKTIEHFGLFGVDKTPVNVYQILSIVMITIGVIIYQKNS